MASWFERQVRRGAKTVGSVFGAGSDPNIASKIMETAFQKRQVERQFNSSGRQTRATTEDFTESANQEVGNAIALLGMAGSIDMTGGQKDVLGQRIDVGSTESEEVAGMRGDIAKNTTEQQALQAEADAITARLTANKETLENDFEFQRGGRDSGDEYIFKGAPRAGNGYAASQEDYDNPDNWEVIPGGADWGETRNYIGPTLDPEDIPNPDKLAKDIKKDEAKLKNLTSAISGKDADTQEAQEMIDAVTEPFAGLEEVRDATAEGEAGSLVRGSSLLNLATYRDQMEKDRRSILRAGQEDLIGLKLTGEHLGKQGALLENAQSLATLRNNIGAGLQIASMAAGGYRSLMAPGGTLGTGLLGFATSSTVRSVF